MNRERDAQRAATDQLLDVDVKLVRDEVRRLREIERWALGTLHVTEGDAVVICESVGMGPGWVPWREVLVVGATGRVHDLYLSQHNGEWSGLFTPDVAWTVSDYPSPAATRRRADPPGCFMLRLSRLRKRTDDDQPLPVPEDLQ